jgi:hypothetical protein
VSLTGADFWSPEHGSVMLTAGPDCFYCARPTSDPAIVWSGAEADVFLHPACAADLMIRLNRDLWEWQRRTGQRFGAAA